MNLGFWGEKICIAIFSPQKEYLPPLSPFLPREGTGRGVYPLPAKPLAIGRMRTTRVSVQTCIPYDYWTTKSLFVKICCHERRDQNSLGKFIPSKPANLGE